MLNIDDPTEGITPFLERLIDAAVEAVSDLRKSPVYIVQMHLPNERGLYIAGLDSIFEREIRAAEKWHGRGRAIAIDDRGVYEQAYSIGRSAGLDERQADRLARLEMSSVVLHELAHAIATGGDGNDGILADGPEIGRLGFDAALAGKPLPARFKVTPPLVPWHGHDARYIRANCHLTHRMRRRHLPDLRYSDTFDSNMYGLSPVGHYAAALIDELDSKAPIRSILATAPPAEFRELWRSDVVRWYASTDGNDEAVAAATAALAVADGPRPGGPDAENTIAIVPAGKVTITRPPRPRQLHGIRN